MTEIPSNEELLDDGLSHKEVTVEEAIKIVQSRTGMQSKRLLEMNKSGAVLVSEDSKNKLIYVESLDDRTLFVFNFRIKE